METPKLSVSISNASVPRIQIRSSLARETQRGLYAHCLNGDQPSDHRQHTLFDSTIPSSRPLLALLRHLAERLHATCTQRSVVIGPVAIKGAHRRNCVARRQAGHASLVATPGRRQEPLPFHLGGRLCRPLCEIKLRACLLALLQLGRTSSPS